MSRSLQSGRIGCPKDFSKSTLNTLDFSDGTILISTVFKYNSSSFNIFNKSAHLLRFENVLILWESPYPVCTYVLCIYFNLPSKELYVDPFFMWPNHPKVELLYILLPVKNCCMLLYPGSLKFLFVNSGFLIVKHTRNERGISTSLMFLLFMIISGNFG